jgi:hypothetical protein
MSATPATMLQVVASGLQDRERLNTVTGKPSTQHYTFLMRKRTRWASQWRRSEFDNIADFGRTATCTIPIEGELITRASLVIELPTLPQIVGPAFAWTNAIGHALCVNTQFLINGEIIDEIDSRLLEVLDEQSPIEHFTSTNTLIGRNPSTYSDLEPQPSTIAVTPPFWWNRGPGPQALPIRALYKDQIQLRVTFRDFAGSIYTSARNADGSMVAWPGAAQHIIDAYWIIEYVSLEDREAAAYRCDMEIPFEQHEAVPPQPTNGNELVRIRLDQSGLVRDLTWVAQRVEAPAYNAYFLFTRDLHGPLDPSGSIWWPDAVGVSERDLNYGRGRIVPAFATAADPILQAKMTIRGLMRFEHEAAILRSLIPALNCARTPLVDRFIYRYDFGYWPTGGLTDALGAPVEIRGCANWDVLPTKELLLQMNVGCDSSPAFYIYAWVTRYNRLRIINGHGAVLFT